MQLHKPECYRPPFSRGQKVPREDANYRMTGGNIAAIDFGTTSVSLAYTTKGDTDKDVRVMPLDAENKPIRVSNSVLFRREAKTISVVAMGNQARTRLKRRINESFECIYIYFERMCDVLNNADRQTFAESFSGEKFYLIEVIAFTLQHLKDQLIDHLSRSVIPLKTTDFDWVITVPAIWDARGKRMMREAAYMAGLLTESKRISEFTPVSSSPLPVPVEVNPDKLSLALASEAAAIYCQVTADLIEDQPSATAVSHPTKYIIVIEAEEDIINITVHFKVASESIVVKSMQSNAWGGRQVNEEFSKLLQEIVGDPGFEKFIASGDHIKMQAMLHNILYDEFENQKYLFGHCICAEVIVSLKRYFDLFYRKDLVKGLKKVSGIEYEDDTLWINKSVVESKLFGPAIQGIIDCTLSAIDKIDNCPSTFYLVGAFGGCKYVHEKVSAAIESHYQSKGHKGTCSVLVPPSPHLAVAAGAAMWRKNLEKFKAIRANATYGIGISIKFDEKKHNEAYKSYDKDRKQYRCDNVFEVFLEKDEIVRSNEVITTILTPERNDTVQKNIGIYATPYSGIQYIKNEDNELIVTLIGELVIDVSTSFNLPLWKRQIVITLDFRSTTEIHARARYRVTGEEVKTVCDYI